MRNLNCRFVFAAIIPALIIFLSGCSIGIKPRSRDVPPEDDVYYEESNYDSYYRRSNSYRYNNPNYDPWTMGTYYQNYSGPARSNSGSGGSSAASVQSGNKRPTVKDRNSTSVNQPKAPASNDDSNQKRNRSSIRKRRKTSSQISESAQRKVRRAGNSRKSQEKKTANTARAKRKRTEIQKTSQKARPEQAKPATAEEEEKEKKKKKRSSR